MNIKLKPLYLLFFVSIIFFSISFVYATPPTVKMQDAVTDTIGLLTPDEYKIINSKILSLEQQKGAQLSVLIVSTTQPYSIEEYSNQVFNQWRLGRLNIDDGVLLVVALDDRTVRIEVGYGLEGQITDHFANQVISDYIIPYFKTNQYSLGIEIAVDALIAKIKQEPLPAVDKTPFFIAKPAGPIGLIDIIAGVVIGSALLLWVLGLYQLLKSHPLKAGIPILLIIYATWYFGGFDTTTGNGLRFGEQFLETDLPRWVQMLFLQIFPSWFAVLMIFSCFIAVVFLFLGALGGFFITLNKLIKSDKLSRAIGASSFIGIVIFFIAYSISNSLIFGLITAVLLALLIGIGLYTGKIKPAQYNSSRSRSRHSSGSYRGGSSSSSSHSSSGRSSGGGGRSGGGGASGRW